jgi:hypothetical protein
MSVVPFVSLTHTFVAALADCRRSAIIIKCTQQLDMSRRRATTLVNRALLHVGRRDKALPCQVGQPPQEPVLPVLLPGSQAVSSWSILTCSEAQAKVQKVCALFSRHPLQCSMPQVLMCKSFSSGYGDKASRIGKPHEGLPGPNQKYPMTGTFLNLQASSSLRS